MAEDERPDAPQDEQASGDAGAPADDTAAAQPAAEASAEEPTAPEVAEPEETADPAPAAPAETAEAEPAGEAPSAPSAAPVEDAPAEEPAPAAAAETPVDDAAAPADAEAAQAPAAADATPADQQRRQRPPQAGEDAAPAEPTAVPGAHLEPDLVLETPRAAGEGEIDPYADPAAADDSPVAEGEQAATVEETPAHTPLDLAADARYPATGKRKRAVARVILRPGQGVYTINGKELNTYFPRITLQKTARLPLETAGYETRMDVVAKIHGGGVSSQAIALRHGIARALVEADPNLRGELKRHGFLTRDARVKERKKAGLKKARKRPQFSKR
jgi:small subunit ribosomal protein S9